MDQNFTFDADAELHNMFTNYYTLGHDQEQEKFYHKGGEIHRETFWKIHATL